jgi:aminoglycoside phosphotransferase (APT) family kinase protein
VREYAVLLRQPRSRDPPQSRTGDRLVVVRSGSIDLARLTTFVERVLGGRIVVPLRRLSGGLASAVFAATVESVGGPRRVVIRCYGPDQGRGPEPPTIRGEVATLEQLHDAQVPVPRVLGADETGGLAGAPALVMTRLPGRISLRPPDLASWTSRLAETLVQIHSLSVAAPSYEPWLDVATLEVPAWTRRPALWRDVIDVLSQPPPAEAVGFVHGDYQHFNILWLRDAISAVLDWTGSWTGPLDVDLAHCRLNLACLFDVGVAEEFRRLYEARAGRAMSGWRDVAGLAGYVPRFAEGLRVQIGRRTRLDADGMTDRVEELLRGALSRL